MRKLLVIAGLLFSLGASAQIGDRFNGTINVYTVPDNTGPVFRFSAFYNDPSGRWASDSTQVGDDVFAFTGSKAYKFTVDSILSKTGGILNIRVRDSTATVASFPTGVCAIMRPTSNNMYPSELAGLTNVLASKIATYFADLADNASVDLTGFATEAQLEDTSALLRGLIDVVQDSGENKLIVPTLTPNYFLYANGTRTATTSNSYISRSALRVTLDSLVALRLPRWTTGGRPTPLEGDFALNKTLNLPDVYINGGWRNLTLQNGALISGRLGYADANGHITGTTNLIFSGSTFFVGGFQSGAIPSSALLASGNIATYPYASSKLICAGGTDASSNVNFAGLRGGVGTNSVKFGYYLNNAMAEQSYISLTNTGLVGIGNLVTPLYTLDVTGTGAIRIPVGTTAQTPTEANGIIRYNSTLSKYQVYDGTRKYLATEEWVGAQNFGGSSYNVRQVSHGFTAPEAVFWNEINYKNADGVVGDTIRVSGVVVQVFSADSFKIQFSGYYADDFSLPEGLYYANSTGGLSLTPDPDATIPVLQVENGYSIINPIVEDEKQALSGTAFTLETVEGSRLFEIGETLVLHRDSLIGNPLDSLTTETTSTPSTAAKFAIHLVNSTGGAKVVTPPASPVAGDWFAVSDSRATANTNNITIDTSTDKLHGAANDYIMNAVGDFVRFTYVNSTVGWIKSN